VQNVVYIGNSEMQISSSVLSTQGNSQKNDKESFMYVCMYVCICIYKFKYTSKREHAVTKLVVEALCYKP
jgi:hypothetical protein